MRQFERARALWGREIRAQVLVLDRGVHISLFGGELPHIGAVSVADPGGRVTTIQFPGHKEALVSEMWAGELVRRKLLPAVVEAGIHYDRLTREQIALVVETSSALLADVLAELDGTAVP